MDLTPHLGLVLTGRSARFRGLGVRVWRFRGLGLGVRGLGFGRGSGLWFGGLGGV